MDRKNEVRFNIININTNMSVFISSSRRPMCRLKLSCDCFLIVFWKKYLKFLKILMASE
jgi:hypothetical protein